MASKNMVEITTENFQQLIQSGQPVLVDFWAPWCGPCRALGPTIDRLADQFKGRVKVGKLNTDDSQETAVKYGITSIPQILFFHGSDQPRQRLVGLQSENALVMTLNRLLGV